MDASHSPGLRIAAAGDPYPFACPCRCQRVWTGRVAAIRPKLANAKTDSRCPSLSSTGCVDWPAGRVLLQWALDGGVPRSGGTVLEIGSGVGLASIGLALAIAAGDGRSPAKAQAAPSAASAPPPSHVIASDVCQEALANLRANAAAHGLLAKEEAAPSCSEPWPAHTSAARDAPLPQPPRLQVVSWDAAGGASAVGRLPVDARQLTHVIGADLASMPVRQLASNRSPG